MAKKRFQKEKIEHKYHEAQIQQVGCEHQQNECHKPRIEDSIAMLDKKEKVYESLYDLLQFYMEQINKKMTIQITFNDLLVQKNRNQFFRTQIQYFRNQLKSEKSDEKKLSLQISFLTKVSRLFWKFVKLQRNIENTLNKILRDPSQLQELSADQVWKLKRIAKQRLSFRAKFHMESTTLLDQLRDLQIENAIRMYEDKTCMKHCLQLEALINIIATKKQIKLSSNKIPEPDQIKQIDQQPKSIDVKQQQLKIIQLQNNLDQTEIAIQQQQQKQQQQYGYYIPQQMYPGYLYHPMMDMQQIYQAQQYAQYCQYVQKQMPGYAMPMPMPMPILMPMPMPQPCFNYQY